MKIIKEVFLTWETWTEEAVRRYSLFKIGVLKNFAIFTGKHLYWSLSLLKETPTQMFSSAYCKIFKNSFFVEQLQWLLLYEIFFIHAWHDSWLLFFFMNIIVTFLWENSRFMIFVFIFLTILHNSNISNIVKKYSFYMGEILIKIFWIYLHGNFFNKRMFSILCRYLFDEETNKKLLK